MNSILKEEAKNMNSKSGFDKLRRGRKRERKDEGKAER